MVAAFLLWTALQLLEEQEHVVMLADAVAYFADGVKWSAFKMFKKVLKMRDVASWVE